MTQEQRKMIREGILAGTKLAAIATDAGVTPPTISTIAKQLQAEGHDVPQLVGSRPRLTVQQRDLIVVKLKERMSTIDIADLLGVSKPTVRDVAKKAGVPLAKPRSSKEAIEADVTDTIRRQLQELEDPKLKDHFSGNIKLDACVQPVLQITADPNLVHFLSSPDQLVLQIQGQSLDLLADTLHQAWLLVQEAKSNSYPIRLSNTVAS
jgi:IS30 family transposase